MGLVYKVIHHLFQGCAHLPLMNGTRQSGKKLATASDIHKIPGTVLGSRNLGVYQSLALLSRNSLSRERERHATNISGSDGMMAWGCHPGSREEP